MLKKFAVYEKCTEAILKNENDKSPDLHGLTNEFYKCFWSEKNL